MARTATYNKEQIIQCAYDIAKEKGKNAITIREIGKRLGKSIAPIYTQYDGIEDIFIDLTAYIKDQIHKSTQKERTISPFLNMGVGFLAFVLENKLIFNDFFLTMDDPIFNFKSEDHSYLEQMKQSPLITVLSDKQLEDILYDMQVYTYGLATIICTGAGGEHDLSYYQNKLEQSGNSLMKYQLYSSGKFEIVFEELIKKISKHVNIEEVLKS